MLLLDRIDDLARRATEWRRDFHRHPELLYDVDRTAGIVADQLEAFGCDRVVRGVGRTGVVGVIAGRRNGSGRCIGLRADMDALPMTERSSLPYRSSVEGRMHACGHDGHTAMLLGAAGHLAATRDFDGTAVVIFQPAEEGGAGGKAMIDDGLVERFGVQEAYALHSKPGLPVGTFGVRPGPMMAASDNFRIMLSGRGGHAAAPEGADDVILAASQLVSALHSIVSRNVNPRETAILSIGRIAAGTKYNILPDRAEVEGTVRTFSPDERRTIERRVKEVAVGIAATFGIAAEVEYETCYPSVVNDADKARFMADAARAVVGDDAVRHVPVAMGSEDFAYILEKVPGAYALIGNGDSASLHHPAYDFDDGAIPYGIALHVAIVERGMPV